MYYKCQYSYLFTFEGFDGECEKIARHVFLLIGGRIEIKRNRTYKF